MKECTHEDLLNWFLCEHAQRRANDIWLNSGHPCKFSMGSWEGITYCSYNSNTGSNIGSGSNTDTDIERTKTAQE